MVSELSSLIHNLVLDNPVPAKDLAKAIGKPYSTLLREVNPYDAGANLGAETLLQIMIQTGDAKPLEYMAASWATLWLPARAMCLRSCPERFRLPGRRLPFPLRSKRRGAPRRPEGFDVCRGLMEERSKAVCPAWRFGKKEGAQPCVCALWGTEHPIATVTAASFQT